ncbi:hypothetical protein F5148DRAFT_1250583, partial [Russula earlei]
MCSFLSLSLPPCLLPALPAPLPARATPNYPMPRWSLKRTGQVHQTYLNCEKHPFARALFRFRFCGLNFFFPVAMKTPYNHKLAVHKFRLTVRS